MCNELKNIERLTVVFQKFKGIFSGRNYEKMRL